MDTHHPHPEAQITLRNGEIIKVNDHVYCSPSWSIREGTPYSVARVMQFLPPENKGFSSPEGQNGATATRKGKGRENWTRVRLAWYYRPSDVSDRNVADSRLLLAAIYSEVCDLNQLRSKCYVLHRDKITNLADWKRRPDHFYFHRLFDPYIKREFEVLLSTDVKNLPQNIRDTLISRYEYIVAEKEVVPDLTDQLRLCDTCGEWCSHLDAVQCAACKNHFHMSCVNPPLLAKPSKGYGWTCAPCSRRHEDRVDSGEKQQGRDGTPKGFGPKGFKGRGRPRKTNSGTATPTGVDAMEIKHFKMWPFRYFGLYTVAEDSLDPDDLIFPRAATRVGHKYQASVPSTKDEPIPRSSGSMSVASDRTEDVDIIRGDSETVETLGLVNHFNESQVAVLDDKMLQEIKIVPDNVWKIDWLVEIVRRASDSFEKGNNVYDMRTPWRKRKWSEDRDRYTDKVWTPEEKHAFDDGIAQYGAELRPVRDEVGTRSMPEVVRYYGLWKNERLKEENERKRKDAARGKGLEDGSSAAKKQDDDDVKSIVDVPPSAPGVRHSNFCAACRTRDSKVWWKAPKGLSTAILCDTCGLNWRKYADLNARPTTREESAMNAGANGATKGRGADKREGTPLTGPVTKKAKVHDLTSGSNRLSPPTGKSRAAARSEPALNECLCCFRKGEPYDVVQCKQCDLGLHVGVSGVDIDALREGKPDDWACELCENEKSQDYSLNSRCVVCNPSPSHQSSYTNTFLRACKPTEGQGWIHVLCSIYHPECQYSDASRLRLVEGISLIPKSRWTATCGLCRKPGGAVVRCSNCPIQFHVSCAWPHGNRFGFEIQPVKSSRRDVIPLVTFKGKCGFMSPVILCREHTSYRSQIYEICDKNDAGETALQVYARTYKQAPLTGSHSLLRKAQRLDQLMHEVSLERGSSASASTFASPSVDDKDHLSALGLRSGSGGEREDDKCVKCGTLYSPLFHPHPNPRGNAKGSKEGQEESVVCHACFFEVKKEVEREKVEKAVVEIEKGGIDAMMANGNGNGNMIGVEANGFGKESTMAVNGNGVVNETGAKKQEHEMKEGERVVNNSTNGAEAILSIESVPAQALQPPPQAQAQAQTPVEKPDIVMSTA